MRKWWDRDFAEEVGVVSQFLQSKGYQIPTEKELKQKNLDYFGVDTDSITSDDCLHLISKYDYGCSTKKGRFLLTYTESFLVSGYKGFELPLTPKLGLELLNSPENGFHPSLLPIINYFLMIMLIHLLKRIF